MSTRKLQAADVAVADVVAVTVAVATCSHFVLPQFATVCRVCTSFSVYCANLVFSYIYAIYMYVYLLYIYS